MMALINTLETKLRRSREGVKIIDQVKSTSHANEIYN